MINGKGAKAPFALPPLKKGAMGDLLLMLVVGKKQQQKQIPLNPPFSKGEATWESPLFGLLAASATIRPRNRTQPPPRGKTPQPPHR